jgi:branched-chain amino acid transport system permease protein
MKDESETAVSSATVPDLELEKDEQGRADESASGLTSQRVRPLSRPGLLAGLVCLGVLVALPWLGLGSFYVTLFTVIFVYSIVNMAWNLILGYGGVLTFGQLAFFAIGAYTAGILNTRVGLPPSVTILAAAVVGAVIGLAIGLPSLRLYGPYMVLFTIALQLIIQSIVATDPTGLTGGPMGVLDIQHFKLPGLGPNASAYYVGLLLLALTYVIVAWILRSPFGLGVQALRDSRMAAEARGVGFVAHRTLLFAISAFLTAMGGGFYAHYIGVVVPTVVSWTTTLLLIAMLIVGGFRTLSGPIVGTALLVYLDRSLASTAEYKQLIWGALIVGFALFVPGGIAGTARRWGKGLLRRVRRPTSNHAHDST